MFSPAEIFLIEWQVRKIVQPFHHLINVWFLGGDQRDRDRARAQARASKAPKKNKDRPDAHGGQALNQRKERFIDASIIQTN